MANKTKAEIRLYFCDPCVLTTEEFEQMQKDVVAHIAVNDARVGDLVLFHLIREHHGRYLEAREINAKRGGSQVEEQPGPVLSLQETDNAAGSAAGAVGWEQWSCEWCWHDRLKG